MLTILGQLPSAQPSLNAPKISVYVHIHLVLYLMSTTGWIVLLIIIPAKVGIKFCRFARVCFIYAYMDVVPTQLEFRLRDQLDS